MKEDIKIDIIKAKQLKSASNMSSFVRIEHLPSGLVVTEPSIVKSQVAAKDVALKKLKRLIEIWEDNGIV